MTIDLRLDPAEVALLTDLYELTVSAAFFDHGFNDIASFEVAMRRMPEPRIVHTASVRYIEADLLDTGKVQDVLEAVLSHQRAARCASLSI